MYLFTFIFTIYIGACILKYINPSESLYFNQLIGNKVEIEECEENENEFILTRSQSI